MKKALFAVVLMVPAASFAMDGNGMGPEDGMGKGYGKPCTQEMKKDCDGSHKGQKMKRKDCMKKKHQMRKMDRKSKMMKNNQMMKNRSESKEWLGDYEVYMFDK